MEINSKVSDYVRELDHKARKQYMANSMKDFQIHTALQKTNGWMILKSGVW